MKSSRRGILSKLDDYARSAGFTPGRVADDMSGDSWVDRTHRPLRWFPLLYIGLTCALLIGVYLLSGQELGQGSPAAILGGVSGIVIGIVTGAILIYAGGPLGKASREDDEREAALRKDSFLFGLGLLAGLNCLGQPILLMMSHWQNWQTAFSLFVVFSVLMLNATLLATLPTLYASWNYRRLPK